MNISGGARRAITIVVPLYDDLKGIEQCVVSLIDAVDTTRDRIILSNDRGPQHEKVEELVSRLIAGHPGIDYISNDVNLGFVGNCNRVVLEYDTTGNDVLLLNSDTIVTPGFLDEMAEVLALSPMHGVVTARSNNATLASIPDRRRRPGQPRTIDRTATVHAAVRDLLPRFTVAPVAMGFCFLTRRELVDEYGLFDEAFAPGYGEENDYCLRVNQFGYLSIVANRALVFHTGSTSFSGDRGPRLRFGHERLLLERYPFYVGSLALYYQRSRDPVDTFADAFAPDESTIRIAVDLEGAGGAELARVEEFVHELGDDVVVTIIAPRRLIAQVKALVPSALVTDRRRVDMMFDVALALGPMHDLARLVRLNDYAPRWILVDEAPSRDQRWSRRIERQRVESVERIALTYADRVIRDDDPDAAAAAVLETVRQPIDVDSLRGRWTHLVDAGLAAGLLSYPRRATVSRRLALWVGSRSPRFSRFLRSTLSR